jgi:carboxylesterase
VIAGADSFYWEGNEVGVLISHGFMGTPQSVHFLGETIADYGYTVYAPRLKGHGTHENDLENCRYEEWFESLEEGYEWLALRCTDVFVIGQSMGGTLTLHLAHKYPDIKGIMLINAALSVPAFHHLEGKSEPRFVEEGPPDIKMEDVYEITYDKAPLKAIHQLQAIMKCTPPLLPAIKTPALCFKSIDDHVVPAENTDYIFEQIGSSRKELVSLHHSYHVASMDYEKQWIATRCRQFIQQHVRQAVLS